MAFFTFRDVVLLQLGCCYGNKEYMRIRKNRQNNRKEEDDWNTKRGQDDNRQLIRMCLKDVNFADGLH